MALAAGAALVLAGGLAGAATAKTTLRVASFTSEKATGVTEMIIPWMKAVEADVGDQVALKGFWGGSLGRSPFAQYDLVKNDVADIAWVGVGYSPGRFPQLEVLNLPFMAKNGVEASGFGWKLADEGLVPGLKDFKVITVWTPSSDMLHMVEPIKSLDDVKGKRIRTASSQQAELITALGGVPQTIGPVEVNDALARGAVDGLVQGYTGMKTFGTFGVVKQSYEVPLGNSVFLLLMNKKKWESLPDDVKASMDKHGGATLAKSGGAAYDAAAARIRQHQMDSGYQITTPTEEQLAAWREQFKKLPQEWIAATPDGQKIFDEFQAYLASVRKTE